MRLRIDAWRRSGSMARTSDIRAVRSYDLTMNTKRTAPPAANTSSGAFSMLC
jgi:hypothetical protein